MQGPSRGTKDDLRRECNCLDLKVSSQSAVSEIEFLTMTNTSEMPRYMIIVTYCILYNLLCICTLLKILGYAGSGHPTTGRANFRISTYHDLTLTYEIEEHCTLYIY